MCVRDRDPVAGPLEQLHVVLAVAERDRVLVREPDPLGGEVEPRALVHGRARELEEVRERLGDVQAPAEAALHLHLEAVELVRVAHDDELRRRLRQPCLEIADGVDDEVLESRIRVRLGRLVRHVELVVDVDEDRVAERLDRRDHLARLGLGHGHVAQELTGHRVGDDGALVAHDRVGDPGCERVAAHRLEHAAGHQEDVDARRLRRSDRRGGARAQHGVLADQGAVEVAGERLHVAGERRRQGEPARQLCVDWKTNAATSAICFGESDPLKEGMTPLPWVTRSRISESGGFFSSRFGPTVPVEPAALSVWQPPHPATFRKMSFPAAGSPVLGTVVVGVVGFGTLPMTVCGVAVFVPSEPHPAATPASSSTVAAASMRWRRRIGASLSCPAARKT